MTDFYDTSELKGPDREKPSLVWWVGQLILAMVACFFVFFGISLLMAAYQLKDPFSFIMTFFAANLIILISAVMGVGFVMRTWRRIRIRP